MQMDGNLITRGTNILLETGTNEMEILEFYIDEENQDSRAVSRIYFGLNVAKVMEVIEAPPIKEQVHDRHPSFLGVISLREHALPLIDLGAWLGLRRRPDTFDVVIVTEFSQTKTGFLVTGVTEIHRVGWNEVAPPEGYLGQVAIGSLVGTVQRSGRIIQLLDLESVLADLDPTSTASFMVSSVKSPKPYKILIADDSPTIRRMVETNLKSANLATEVVGDGQAAWEKLLAHKKVCLAKGLPIEALVELVISDIEMPRMDGFSLTRKIKSDEILKTLPVILYSSIITDELRHKGLSVGADEQVSKPELGRVAERAIALIKSKEN